LKRKLASILYRSWQVLAGLIILLAVLMSIARFLLPYANDQKHHLESWLTTQLGTEVSINELSASWETFGPSLTLHDINIEGVIYIGSVQADINTIPSIFYRNIITDNLTITGINLVMKQNLDGSFDFDTENSIPNNTDSSSQSRSIQSSELQDWLQSQNAIKLSDSHISVTLRNGKSYPIEISQMDYRRGMNLYQLRGFSQLPGDNRIDFTLEADGYLTDPETVGQLYIDTHRLNMAELPLSAFWQEAKIKHGAVAIQIWVDWKNRRFEEALSTILVEDFQLSFRDKLQGRLNKLDTQLIWKHLENGWQLQTSNAKVQSQGRDWPDPFVQLRVINDPTNYDQNFHLRSSLLDIGIWSDLVLANPDLDSEFRERLLAMNTRGFLDSLLIDAKRSGNSIEDFTLNARFSEISFNPYDKTPGLTNLAGQVQINEDRGNLYLDSRYTTYLNPQLFREPINIDYINSDIDWHIDEQQFNLQIQHLSVEVLGATLLADGEFKIETQAGEVWMNLYAETKAKDVDVASYFLPHTIMSNELVNYLDDSILSGSLENTKIMLRGNAKDFPFTNGDGIFAIHAQVKNNQFQFDPKWPIVNEMDADLWFIGNSMHIQVNEGNSHKQNIIHGEVGIADFSATPGILTIKASSKGTLEDAPHYILNSPLKEDLSPVLESIPAKGDFELGLDLTIPLSSESDNLINGQIKLSDNELTISGIGLKADQITGTLDINNGFLVSNNLKARILGGMSQINLDQTNNDSGLETKINLLGDFHMEQLYELLPTVIPSGFSGSSAYQAEVVIPSVEHERLNIKLNTRLDGVESRLPAPLNKESNVGWPFEFAYRLSTEDVSQIELRWIDKFHLILEGSADADFVGMFKFGSGDAIISGTSGVEITGEVESLDVVQWLDYISEYETPAESPELDAFRGYYLNEVAVTELNYFFLHFDDTKVSGNLSQESLNFLLAGSDIEGTIQIPMSLKDNPIMINLDRLQVDDQFAEETVPSEPNLADADAEPLPAINLICKECIYRDAKLGTTEVILRPLDNGNSFKVKMEKSNVMAMDIEGEWSRNSEIIESKLSGTVTTRNLGRLLTLLHQDIGIRDTPMIFDGELKWLGDPSMYNSASLSGNISASGGKGSQEELSDRKARIFSLFSLGSIARKLTLDFSDLFEDGFFYTSMKGNFAISDGVFETNDFNIKGTSADVKIKGKTDFANNHIEQCIVVTPDLSSSLPILAGWAIEPVTGLLVFLMSKIFEPAIDVISSIRYKVEGSFEDPVVTEVGKSRAKATIQNAQDKDSTITIEGEEKPFNCDDMFKN